LQTEFEETILEDLSLIEIHGDRVTHTSDYFDTLYELALKLIKAGKAYTDDTEKAQVIGTPISIDSFNLLKYISSIADACRAR
jgi:hypothetical protein